MVSANERVVQGAKPPPAPKPKPFTFLTSRRSGKITSSSAFRKRTKSQKVTILEPLF